MSSGDTGIIEAEFTRTDLAQMKMENDSIMAMCQMRPRKIADIKQALTEQLDAFPDLADKSIYEKPVGSDGSGKQKTVEGLSIRAAESLAELYGYNRIRSDVTPLDEFTVKVEATFTDYQNGRVWQDGGIVSKKYKTRNGSISIHADDRFYNVIVKAEISRRIREVILRSVNAALKEWFYVECCKRIDAILTDDKVAAIVKQFAGIGVTNKQLDDFIGRPPAMGWTMEDRRKLLGIWNAIRDGESTVAEAFATNGAPKTESKTLDEVADKLKSKSKSEAKPDPQKSMSDTAAILAKFATDISLAKTLAEVNTLYDAAFGPDSTVEWTPEENSKGAEIAEARRNAIRNSRGSGSKQG